MCFNIEPLEGVETSEMNILVFQTQLDESQIDAAFKNLFRQLAGPVSTLKISEGLEERFLVFNTLNPNPITFVNSTFSNRTWRSASQSCKPF